MSDLVSGILSDTTDLLGAHVDAIRNELTQGLADLRDRMIAMVLAAAVGIAAAVAVIMALAVTLVTLGLQPWAAHWIVAGVALIGLALVVRRAKKQKTGSAGGDPGAAVARAGQDAAWLADRASDAVT